MYEIIKRKPLLQMMRLNEKKGYMALDKFKFPGCTQTLKIYAFKEYLR